MLDLKKDKRFRYIPIFKNHGEAAGASLEHSTQLIALPIVPKLVREEIDGVKLIFL
jgi:UDPglucose--hexose-1-phosphate uridylyltransferase